MGLFTGGAVVLLAVLAIFGMKRSWSSNMGRLATLLVLAVVLAGCSEMEQGSEEQPADRNEQATEVVQQKTVEQRKEDRTDEENYVQTAKQKKPAASANRVSVKLSRVVDGDTIKVYYRGKEESVRYLLMDTPESKKPGECVQPYAEKASKRNEQLVKSGKLTLEFEKSRTDKYGRLLAYVFVDGKSVQETLIKEGLARVAYIYEPPYKYLNDYEKAQEYAKGKRLNIWSKKGYVSSRGFNGCADGQPTKQPAKKPAKQPAKQPAKKPAAKPAPTGKKEYFKNCTELRKKYPKGVPEGHPAYQPKMDRDKDGYACER